MFRSSAVTLALLLVLLAGSPGHAETDPHLVGWTNTFIPGAGRWLLGDVVGGLGEFGIETATFGLGYGLSKRTTLTIDGVPEDYPAYEPGLGGFGSGNRTVCQKYDPAQRRCVKLATLRGSGSLSTLLTPVDFSRPLTAALLQEVGLKYHMMNVFSSYQASLKARDSDLGQGLEDKNVTELFFEPFQKSNLTDPWVYIPLALVVAATAVDYSSQIHSGLTPTQPLTGTSNAFVGFNQLILYPVGSGVPEEGFYRGFLQNEFYFMTRSPVASVLMSATAFSLSHSPPGHLTAGLSGLYLGTLAAINHGKLGPGVTLHFWSVVALGIETFVLTKKSQAVPGSAPLGLQASIPF